MTGRRSLPGSIRLFLLVSMLADSVCLGCEAVARHYLHLGWPYNSPVLNENPVPDLRNFIEPFQHLHTVEFFSVTWRVPYMYPAPVAPLYSFFLGLPKPNYVFEAVLAVLLVAAAVLFGWRLLRAGLSLSASVLVAGGTLILSYPALFELKQGNMELFVVILVALGVGCFLRDHLHAAAVLFGVAAAMKLFPFVYLGLFFARRKYPPLLTAAVTGAVVTLLSLLYLGPSVPIAWHGIARDLSFYQQTVVLAVRHEIGYDHTVFAILKLGLQFGHRSLSAARLTRVLHWYMAVAALGGVALFFWRIVRLPVNNQVLCLCVASILLPPVSYDYTLLHLYVPWAMLVFFAIDRGEGFTPGLRIVFTCFALATSMEGELIYHGYTHDGQVKAVVLVALFIVALVFPFGDRESGLLSSSRLH